MYQRLYMTHRSTQRFYFEGQVSLRPVCLLRFHLRKGYGSRRDMQCVLSNKEWPLYQRSPSQASNRELYKRVQARQMPSPPAFPANLPWACRTQQYQAAGASARDEVAKGISNPELALSRVVFLRVSLALHRRVARSIASPGKISLLSRSRFSA